MATSRSIMMATNSCEYREMRIAQPYMHRMSRPDMALAAKRRLSQSRLGKARAAPGPATGDVLVQPSRSAAHGAVWMSHRPPRMTRTPQTRRSQVTAALSRFQSR